MTIATARTGARPVRAGRRPPLAWVGTVPFLAYTGIFLLLPTGIVIWNAFKGSTGGWTLSNITALNTSPVRSAFTGSLELCVISSVIGAMLGAILAYAIASGNPDGVVRRLYLAGSGVLAQFGGVTLAFAFLATIGPVGFVVHASWYSNFPWGIGLIYCYFQIPLMVLVFLPAIDGLKSPVAGGGREPRRIDVAVLALRGRSAAHAGLPRCGLLLFANALSAFATIEAWEDQINYVVPQSISGSLISEVGLANVHEGDALALGMIVVVVIVMTGYFLLQRRAARWQR